MTAKAAEALRLLARALEHLADEQEREQKAPVPTSSVAPLAWLPIRACGLPLRTARRLVREGAIGASRVGRDVYVCRGDVEAWLESQRITPAAPSHAGDEVDQALARRRLRLVGR